MPGQAPKEALNQPSFWRATPPHSTPGSLPPGKGAPGVLTPDRCFETARHALTFLEIGIKDRIFISNKDPALPLPAQAPRGIRRQRSSRGCRLSLTPGRSTTMGEAPTSTELAGAPQPAHCPITGKQAADPTTQPQRAQGLPQPPGRSLSPHPQRGERPGHAPAR